MGRLQGLQVFYVVLAALVCLVVTGAEEPRGEAEAFLKRAREVSDIRCEGCPPFQLRASVELLRMPRGTSRGTYLLIWISPTKWREEIDFPGFEQVRVGGEGKVWQARSTSYLPLRLFQLMEAMSFRRRLRVGPDESVGKIKKPPRGKSSLACLELKGKLQANRLFCFDPTAGVLMHEGTRSSEEDAFEYEDYAPWGAKRFPRTLRAFELGELVVKVYVEEMSEATSVNEGLFSPPSGAVEWPGCEDPEPALGIEKSLPHYPEQAKETRESGTVFVYAIVKADGRVSEVEVLRSAGGDLDRATVDAVKQWRYRPASCGGTAVPEEKVIHIVFELRQ